MTRNEPPCFDPALYDADFFTWTQRRAATLRATPQDASVNVALPFTLDELLGRPFDIDAAIAMLALADGPRLDGSASR